MTLSRPNAVLAVDGRQLSAAQAALLHLVVRLGLGGAHDPAQMLLWSRSKLATTKPGAKISIALGESGSETDVWSGEVTAVANALGGARLDCIAATVAFSRQRVSRSYTGQTVADIVNDLAGGAPIDQVSGDTTLSSYAVDDRRPVWSHLLELAEIAGADVSSSASGGLRFVPVRTGSPDVSLRYGADILSWDGGAASQPAAASVAAYGAASEQWAAQWHWIRSAAASGATAPVRVDPSLRTHDAADALASALASRATRAEIQGRLIIVGRPALRPGALIELTGLPAGSPGTLRVLWVEHRLDTQNGFVSTVGVEGAEP
jgi:phage protein D